MTGVTGVSAGVTREAKMRWNRNNDRPEHCGYVLGCPYDPLCRYHANPDRREMVEQLDAALHGDTWARPTSPSVVWRDLLGEVAQMSRRCREVSS